MTITWPYVTSLLYLPIVTVHNIWQLALYIKKNSKEGCESTFISSFIRTMCHYISLHHLYNPYLDILINEISVILIIYNKSTLTFTI